MDKKRKLNLILRWSQVHLGFFLVAFLTFGLLSSFFPDFMLSLFGKWAELLSMFGARSADEFTSAAEMFTHILGRNAVAALVYFVLGILLQAPLAMLFSGAFYAFIAFLAQLTLGRALGPLDWLLITVEVISLVASATLSTGFAGELYQVAPTTRDWWRYSKKAWRSLSMKAPVSWRELLPTWLPSFGIGLPVIAGMILFVAWFEVYGY